MGLAEATITRSRSTKSVVVDLNDADGADGADGAPPTTTLNYVKPTTVKTRFLGMPRLLHYNVFKTFRQIGALIGVGASQEQRSVPLHDARQAAGLSYAACGFTLEPLQSAVTDWAAVQTKGSASQVAYRAELEAIVRRLHPDVKAMAWSTFLLRGGPGENGPAAGAIHLDWFPDVERVQEFLGAHPKGFHDLNDTAAQVTAVEGHEALRLKLVLGLWKPRNARNPVVDAPLVVCDPSTVDMAAEAVPQEQLFLVKGEGRQIPVANVAANLKYSTAHKWYYYKEQTADEVFVFRHATMDEPHMANFHCGGVLPLPPGMEKRSSVETRVLLYF
jgi:hypothetical protein